jgi:hypothetical protein
MVAAIMLHAPSWSGQIFRNPSGQIFRNHHVPRGVLRKWIAVNTNALTLHLRKITSAHELNLIG